MCSRCSRSACSVVGMASAMSHGTTGIAGIVFPSLRPWPTVAHRAPPSPQSLSPGLSPRGVHEIGIGGLMKLILFSVSLLTGEGAATCGVLAFHLAISAALVVGSIKSQTYGAIPGGRLVSFLILKPNSSTG